MAGDHNAIKLTDAMHGADFIIVDGVMFETEYLRVPDEYTVADDVVHRTLGQEQLWWLTAGVVFTVWQLSGAVRASRSGGAPAATSRASHASA